MPIDVAGLTYTYMPGTPFEHTAVKNVSLSIADGEFLGIIGHTGSGKTTFVQMLAALLKPTAGSIFIDGQNINDKKMDKKALRRKLGVVFQYPEYQLFEETVYKDIAYGPQKLGLTDIEQKVSEAMSLVGLSEDISESSPFELSGGQKRKVAIAGVLAMKPQILIMDEPIAGLDPMGRQALMQLVAKLNARGTTIIMISHNMENLAEYADRIIAFKNGSIVMDGTPRQVFSDYEGIASAGLELPDAANVVRKLNERGKNVPREIITYKQLKEYLLERMSAC